MKKNRIIISFVLAMTLVIANTFNSFAIIDEVPDVVGVPDFPQDVVIQEIDDGNGVTYTIKSYIEDDVRKVQMTSDNSTDILVITNDNAEEINIENYELVDDGSSTASADDVYSVHEETYDINQLAEEYDTQTEANSSLSYGQMYFETYKNSYYYAMGMSSAGNQYMKIGSVAKYDVKYWMLTNAQKAKCDTYASEIRQVKNHMSSVNQLATANWLLAGASVLFAAGAVSMPIAIALLGAVSGGTYAARAELAGAQEDYFDAAYYYSIIKYYPHL